MTPKPLNIRAAKPSDRPDIWNILKPVFRTGESYPVDRNVNYDGAMAYWFAADKTIFVCEDSSGLIVGTYYIKPNSTGPADHICNCGYATLPAMRGKTIGTQMCKHSFEQARAMGFRGMQFNLVVVTNHVAVKLWKKLGLDIIGTTPGAFKRPDGTYVDAHIMYRAL